MENDWTRPSPKVISVFNVWDTRDNNWRKPHYPAYDVQMHHVGSAYSLECAERLVRELARENREAVWRPDLHSVRILEQPVGKLHAPFECFSEYLYDREGQLLDKRITATDSHWPGRSDEEIRFHKGDLCEILSFGRMVLGIVQDVPPSVERVKALGSAFFDDTDDAYTVLIGQNMLDYHIDSLKIFKPGFKVSARSEEKLRRAFDESQTLWMRQKIAGATAEAQLRAIMEELGWEAELRSTRWVDDTIGMEIRGVPGFRDGLSLQIPLKTAHEHMDRLRISFLRLAGRRPEGKGYNLRNFIKEEQ